MLSERNGELVERITGRDVRHGGMVLFAEEINRLLDAARAEGGGASGSATGTQPQVVQQTGADVEELVDWLRKDVELFEFAAAARITQAADALLSLSRLLQERTAERDEARRDIDQFVTCMCGSPVEDHWGNGHSPVSVAEYYYQREFARAETAERRLEEVVDPELLTNAADELERVGGKSIIVAALRSSAHDHRQALSNLDGDG